jgi:hypothetical protein
MLVRAVRAASPSELPCEALPHATEHNSTSAPRTLPDSERVRTFSHDLRGADIARMWTILESGRQVLRDKRRAAWQWRGNGWAVDMPPAGLAGPKAVLTRQGRTR